MLVILFCSEIIHLKLPQIRFALNNFWGHFKNRFHVILWTLIFKQILPFFSQWQIKLKIVLRFSFLKQRETFVNNINQDSGVFQINPGFSCSYYLTKVKHCSIIYKKFSFSKYIGHQFCHFLSNHFCKVVSSLSFDIYFQHSDQ